MALDLLPIADRPVAVSRFFTAAAVAVWSPVCDPADLCGEIQPDMDRTAANAALTCPLAESYTVDIRSKRHC